MVVSSPPSGHAARVPFSFADDQLGCSQPVRVTLGGFEYPGEVIVARNWLEEFGRPLPGVSMFRLVLLHSSDVLSPEAISDARICVALPRARNGRVAEPRVTCAFDGPEQQRPAESDIHTLQEVRRNFVDGNDPGLGRLASALATYETEVNALMAADSHEKWKTGLVVTSFGRTGGRTGERAGPEIQPGELFLLNDPVSWVESAAAALTGPGFAVIPGDDSTPEEIFGGLQAGRLAGARELLRQLCGMRIDEPTPVDRIAELFARADREVSGSELVELLIHRRGYPPAVASLWLVAYVLDSRSELELAAMGAATGEARREYLSEETISEIAYDADLITRTVAVRAEKSSDWDAVLPFLRLVVPGANFTVFGGGRESDATEFAVELSTLCDRVRQAAPVMFQLEIAAGAIDRPLTCRVAGLVEVLGAGDWRRYVAMAREMFGSVGMLKAALARADQQWFAVEYAGDIERTIYYLDQVEFGRVDHSLALEHRALRARFDLKALVENPNAWWALCDEFERWRKEYRRAYLQDHAQRRERDLVLRERIDRTTVRVCQIELLDRVEVLRGWPEPGLQDDLHVEPEAVHSDGLFADIPGAWDRVAGPFRVCESDGSGIPLINEPVCPGCRGRLGQAVSHTDVLELIAEVDRVFDAYRDRLGSVVSDLVLSSEDSDRLQKLFRLNSAGDLSDLANVLDDKVISFLNELFGDVSGNLDDWTLPPS